MQAPDALVGCKAIVGAKQVQRVLEVDQTPIGKTPRSCPATYIGLWDTIRKMFSETLENRSGGMGMNHGEQPPRRSACSMSS